MCRFVAYVGQPISLESLVTLPRNSLINQSVDAREFEERLNGDGFGVAWYAHDVSDEPAVFKSVSPAWSNRNLHSLARVVHSSTILAHVRAATPGMPVTETNCHPFARGRYAFMHNGHVGDFKTVRRPMRRFLSDDSYDAVEGSTDSEHLFGLFLDRVAALGDRQGDDALALALGQTVRQVGDMQAEFGNRDPSYLNIAVSDGVRVAACRFTDGPPEDALSLYYRTGRQYICEDGVCRMIDGGSGKPAVIVSSERLSDDDGWKPVPVNHMVLVREDHTVELRPLG
ncbi:MAG: class II glutamine amidotransferase [Planctomycetes bacterium]|nr:class II glutamine amidotransferase [Planctomycetota bacterium]